MKTWGRFLSFLCLIENESNSFAYTMLVKFTEQMRWELELIDWSHFGSINFDYLKLLVKIIENYTNLILSITFIYYCSGAKSRIKLYLDWGTCFYLRLPSSDNRKNSKNDFFLEYRKTSPFFLTQNSNRFVEKVNDLIANLRAIVIFITFFVLILWPSSFSQVG